MKEIAEVKATPQLVPLELCLVKSEISKSVYKMNKVKTYHALTILPDCGGQLYKQVKE